MLRVCSTEGCLPIRNVCLFNDGKGAFKNIMRRLSEQLLELPEMCVCVSARVHVQGSEKPNSVAAVLSCSFTVTF